MSLTNHPCFSDQARHTIGRIHLPVAPRCNIQCNFCNRKYDCVNESRPGVTSGILTPDQAVGYLQEVLITKPNIGVVGIAGPGDPFANPDETLKTLWGVRNLYPEMVLCVASNGLNVLPYVEDLVAVNLSHITITINAVDPDIGARIYAWVRHEKRVWAGTEGAQRLLANQLAAITALKAHGLTVKVNCVVLPGVNDDHVPVLAKLMADLGVDILNCIPFYPNDGAAFGHLSSPSRQTMTTIRQQAGQYLPQMRHCARCRADAVGLVGEANDPALMERLSDYAALSPIESARPYVAAASLEGVLVNQHLGEADELYIYKQTPAGIRLHERRTTPPSGSGVARWEALAAQLGDCRALLVSGIGQNPREVLEKSGITIMVLDGVIHDAIQSLYAGRSLAHLMKRPPACGAECSGQGSGCG
jgi:nitrogen fixation protein NifB